MTSLTLKYHPFKKEVFSGVPFGYIIFYRKRCTKNSRVLMEIGNLAF
jgi:hypothetical protein